MIDIIIIRAIEYLFDSFTSLAWLLNWWITFTSFSWISCVTFTFSSTWFTREFEMISLISLIEKIENCFEFFNFLAKILIPSKHSIFKLMRLSHWDMWHVTCMYRYRVCIHYISYMYIWYMYITYIDTYHIDTYHIHII